MHSTTQMNLIVLLVAFLCGSGTERTRADESVPQRREGMCFPVLDLQGSIHELGQNDRNAIRVFVFLSTECPISNSYIQTLNQLRRSLNADEVELFGVASDATVKRAEAATQRHRSQSRGGGARPVCYRRYGENFGTPISDAVEPRDADDVENRHFEQRDTGVLDRRHNDRFLYCFEYGITTRTGVRTPVINIALVRITF